MALHASNGKRLLIFYILCLSLCVLFMKLKEYNSGSGVRPSNRSDNTTWIPFNRKEFTSNVLDQSSSFDNSPRSRLEINIDSAQATPMIFYYLPHLNNDLETLRPIHSGSKTRHNAWLVMGIVTVYRKDVDYLTPTVESLLSNLRPEQMRECVIVVLVAEIERTSYYTEVLEAMKTQFPGHIESGLLEIIASPSSFYPNLTNPAPLFDDTLKRAKWRRKQNLDYVYLMMYAQSKGEYYIQLEDDIITCENYYSEIKNFLSKQQSDQWLIINFSRLGFIGKFFRTSFLFHIMEFLLMFYKDKPCDWLLLHFIEVLTCDGYNVENSCLEQRKLLMIYSSKMLFQHIGKQSSLEGKIQLIQEKNFVGAKPIKSSILERPINFNPFAIVLTSLESHKGDLQGLYSGHKDIFWGKNPKIGDVINITFFKATRIDRYAFYTGNSEHPGDRLYDADLQVLTAEASHLVNGIKYSGWSMGKGGEEKTRDDKLQLIITINGEINYLDDEGFLTVDRFSEKSGILSGKLDQKFGLIKSLRLIVRNNSRSWVIFTKIILTKLLNRTESAL